MKVFLLKYVIFSICIAAVLFAMSLNVKFENVMQFAWLCFALFFILGAVTFYFSSSGMKGRFANFMNIYFAGIIVKLIITGIVVLLFKSAHPESKSLNFIIPFSLIYFSFLIFETIELVKLSRKNS